jgi:hypothetical protein
MDSSTLLDYALFQLTPTRTRYNINITITLYFHSLLTLNSLRVVVFEAKNLLLSYIVVFVCEGVIWFSSVEARMRNWLLGYLNHSFYTLNLLKIRFPKLGTPSNFAHRPKMLLGSPKVLLRGNESET